MENKTPVFIMRLLLLIITSVSLYSIPLTHKIALSSASFAKPEKQVPFTGFYRLKQQSDLFFSDLGAKFFSADSEIQGFYLSFQQVRSNSGKTFGKWHELLRKPRNTKLLELFEANLASSKLSELFSFPREVTFLKDAKNKTVLVFVDFSIPLSMQIREILNFSLRGYNVLAIDFYHYSEGKNFISWKHCKKIADSAYDSIQGEVLLYGKSFGSAPAAYLASKHPNTQLILDRPFTCMNEALGSFFLDNFINIHYSYPTNELIKKVQKHPLIISSSDSNIFKDHAHKLLNAYISSQKNNSSDKLRSKCFLSSRGGHYSSLLNKGVSSWFSYEKAQRKLNQYLTNCEDK
ncbi:MAG: hypothetical protein S4CHLAM20_05180 [Chlamydiia bacterium]|nr:hypothetical protein [Chlamydiia bacterium]